MGGVALSGQTLAVVVGSLAGATICLALVVAAGVCVKYRRYRALRDKARQSPSLGHLTGTQRSQGKKLTITARCAIPVLKFNDIESSLTISVLIALQLWWSSVLRKPFQ